MTTDTSYAGVKTITFSGPGASPSGTSPSYPATVTFLAGVGTPSITLYNAATATLSATDSTINGSTSVTVVAGAVSQLRYTTSTPSCSGGSVIVGNGGSFTSRVTVYDAFLNPVSQASNRTVTLTRSSVTGTLSPTSLTISTGASETSASFTFSLPNGSPPDTTITDRSPALRAVIEGLAALTQEYQCHAAGSLSSWPRGAPMTRLKEAHDRSHDNARSPCASALDRRRLWR